VAPLLLKTGQTRILKEVRTMEKTMTINGRVRTGEAQRVSTTPQDTLNRRDHLKVWREIYQDVRRQWAEAEHTRTRKAF